MNFNFDISNRNKNVGLSNFSTALPFKTKSNNKKIIIIKNFPQNIFMNNKNIIQQNTTINTKEEPTPITKEEPTPITKEEPTPITKEEPNTFLYDESVIDILYITRKKPTSYKSRLQLIITGDYVNSIYNSDIKEVLFNRSCAFKFTEIDDKTLRLIIEGKTMVIIRFMPWLFELIDNLNDKQTKTYLTESVTKINIEFAKWLSYVGDLKIEIYNQQSIIYTEPVVENLEPVVENLEPLVENLEPVVENLEPVVENLEPLVENLEPVVENLEPVVENLEPVVENLEPVVENLEPVVENLEPLVENLEHVVENLEPVVENLEHVVENLEHVVENLEHVVENLEPVKNDKEIFYIKLNRQLHKIIF
jgi:methyl-accepting chemotaxis protein